MPLYEVLRGAREADQWGGLGDIVRKADGGKSGKAGRKIDFDLDKAPWGAFRAPRGISGCGCS
jgi:hypothetical protein